MVGPEAVRKGRLDGPVMVTGMPGVGGGGVGSWPPLSACALPDGAGTASRSPDPALEVKQFRPSSPQQNGRNALC
jgi:hypothetical protein